MLASRQTRGLLAGMGVTGSLLAAVAAGFALTGGVLGFHAWPSAGPATADRALRVAPRSPQSDLAAPLALAAPPAAGPARTAGTQLAAPGTAGPVVRTAPVERRRTTTRVPGPAPASVPVAVGPAAGLPSGPAAPAATQAPAAALVAGATRTAATTVRTATGAVAQAA